MPANSPDENAAVPGDATVVRPARLTDRAFLDSLDDRLLGEAAVPGIAREKLHAFQSKFTRAALDGLTAGSVTLVAVDPADRPLGYIHLEPLADELSGSIQGYVSIIAVTAEAEGRGVARRLMQAAEDWARAAGYRFLLLDVFASNTTARRFYAAQGFAEDSLRLRRAVSR
jgi:GNAT superfamily N-acetyltransferase